MTNIQDLSDEELKSLARSYSSSGTSIAKQAVAGIPAGILSIGDLPAALGNLGLWGIEKSANALGGNLKTPTIPYVFQDLGNSLADKVVGKPQTQEEEYARIGGNIGGAFINPSSLIPKLGGAKQAITSTQKLNKFKEAGITPTLGEITTSKPVMIAEEGLKRTPGSAGTFEKAALKREEELNNLFSQYGEIEKALSPEAGGQIVRAGAKEYNKKAREVSSKLYDKAFNSLDQKSMVPLNKTLQAIDEALTAITPQAREILQNSNSGRALIRLENAIKQNGGSLPVGDLKKVYRSDLDDLIKSWNQIGSSEQGTLKNIRGILDAETKAFVETTNPEAAKNFTKADKFWSDFSKNTKKTTNKLASSENSVQNFNNIITGLKKGDIKAAKVVLQRLPNEDKVVLSSSFLNELGRGTNGQFDPYKWAKEFKKLRPESRTIMTSGLPKESAKRLESIAEALELSKVSKGQANHSGTAYTGMLLGTGAGLFNAPVETLGTLGAAYGASKIFTNPKVIDALYSATKAKTPTQLEKIVSKYKSVLPAVANVMSNKETPSQSIQDLSDEQLNNLLKQY